MLDATAHDMTRDESQSAGVAALPSVDARSPAVSTASERAARASRGGAVVALASALARIGGALLILRLGFRVVSDDDFARVVIAQKFAAQPHLDPTGSSWLPLPFWLVGGAMRVLGPTLDVARGLALVAAALGGAFVAWVAVRAGMRPRRALAAAVLAAWMPWAMQLAVATVPEAPAAAFAAAGVITLAATSPGLRVVGSFGLLVSCWSRYDAWPMALAFAVCCALDAMRSHGRARRLQALAAVLALFGPASWSLWQAVVYHDAFRYLGLVRSYRQALGQGPSIVHRVLGYPLGVVEEMREVLAAGLVGALAAWRLRRARSDAPSTASGLRWSRPLAVAAFQLVLLVVGDVRDGAPTHHPERALLAPATIVLFAAGDALGAWLSTRARAQAWLVAGVCATLLAGWIGVRLHRSLRWYEGAPRPREVAAGRALAEAAGGVGGGRVLVDTRDLAGGAPDYGYYAVLAAFGRPLEADVDRDQDPRRPRAASSFGSVEALGARVAVARDRWLLAWGDEHRRIATELGARVVAEEPADAPAPRWVVLALP